MSFPKQAQAILDMRLQRLTGLEREKLKKNMRIDQTNQPISEILANERLLLNIIREELLEIKETYGDKDENQRKSRRNRYRRFNRRGRSRHYTDASRIYQTASGRYV